MVCNNWKQNQCLHRGQKHTYVQESSVSQIVKFENKWIFQFLQCKVPVKNDWSWTYLMRMDLVIQLWNLHHQEFQRFWKNGFVLVPGTRKIYILLLTYYEEDPFWVRVLLTRNNFVFWLINDIKWFTPIRYNVSFNMSQCILCLNKYP